MYSNDDDLRKGLAAVLKTKALSTCTPDKQEWSQSNTLLSMSNNTYGDNAEVIFHDQLEVHTLSMSATLGMLGICAGFTIMILKTEANQVITESVKHEREK